MATKESVQQKLKRVRPPRVRITYDVEIGGAQEVKDLPFVVGVVGDFSGNPEKPLPRLKDRKVVEVDRDNFDQVLAGAAPRLQLKVENKVTGEGALPVELSFGKLDDFEPDQLVQQVEPLRRLVQTRQRLRDLLSKTDGNEKLEALLEDVLNSTDSRERLGQALGLGAEPKREEPHD